MSNSLHKSQNEYHQPTDCNELSLLLLTFPSTLFKRQHDIFQTQPFRKTKQINNIHMSTYYRGVKEYV